MPLQIVRNDITKMKVEAIVNPTDELYSGSGGTDLAIHTAAGPELDRACSTLPSLSVGTVAVTQGYALPCKYVLHTMGPVWNGGRRNESVLLRSCYLNALLKARELHVKSIAFPLISSGTFGFPKDRVLRIALAAIRDYLQLLDTEPDVFLCVFDRKSYELSEQLDLEQFLSGKAKSAPLISKPQFSEPMVSEMMVCKSSCIAEEELDEWLKRQDDSFAVTLLKLIDKKGMTDVQCYKKANVSKKTFWKINNDPSYRPSKPTVLAFAIALELTLPETESLLKTVGFSLSGSNTFDRIIQFYIQRGIYDIYEINSALYQYDQMCLGC